MTDVAYDDRTALIVVDMQNDFAHPNGSLYVEGGDAIVDDVNDEIARAREGEAFVVYTQDWHPESTPHFEKDGGVWPAHCVKDTWGAQFHDDLAVGAGAEIVQKGADGGDGYSGFSVRDPESGDEHATRLGALLEDRGIRRVVVVGLAQDYCVKETAIDAAEAGYETRVPLGLTRAVDLQPGDGDQAVSDMRTAGADVA